MEWESSSKRISQLLNDNPTVLQVIQDVSFKGVMKKQMPSLMDFLINNIGEITDIALGSKETSDENSQSSCLTILTTQIYPFTSQLLSNQTILQHLYQFIIQDDDNVTAFQITSFSIIFRFLLQVSKFSILNDLPNKSDFFLNLLHHIKHYSVCNIIDLITMDSRNFTIQFLEDCSAIKVMFDIISEPNYPFKPKLLHFIENIVSSADINSSLLSIFDQNLINLIISYSTQSESIGLSDISFDLLHELYCICNESETTSVLSNYDDMLLDQIPLICNYIINLRTFETNSEKAIQLIRQIIQTKSEIIYSENILNLMKNIFEKFFAFKTNSFLHNSFLCLMQCVFEYDNEMFVKFVIEVNMRKRIIETFRNKKKCFASFWGQLIEISELINKNEILKNENEWKCFFDDLIQPEQNIMDNNYGGSLMFQEEEEMEFPIGNSQLKTKDIE